MTDRAMYAWALSRGLRHVLFEIDQTLSGKAEKTPFRLIPDRYEEAREAIATLYRIVGRPEIEPTPQATAVQRAQRDVGFQHFMRSALVKRRRRSRD